MSVGDCLALTQHCHTESLNDQHKVMSESNLYKLEGVCYFVSVIHKTLNSPPGSIN